MRWASPPDKRGDAAAELQIIQADFAQKFQALANFRQNIAGNLGFAPLSFTFRKSRERLRPKLGRKNRCSDTRLAWPFRSVWIQQRTLAVQSHGARERIQSRAIAIRASLAFAFLPFEPRFLDGIGARAAIHVRQIKQFAETAAGRTPALRRSCS